MTIALIIGVGVYIRIWHRLCHIGKGYAKAMQQSGATTLMKVISDVYGPRAEHLGSVLSSIGIIISIISLVVSACALILTTWDFYLWDYAAQWCYFHSAARYF